MKHFVTAVRNYLATRSRREQLLLSCGGALLVLSLGYWLAWQPLMQARANSAARVQQAEQSLASVNRMAAELERVRTRPAETAGATVGAQSLPLLINTLASDAGLAIASLEPSADNRSAGLRMDAVPMTDLLAWLQQLEAQPDVVLEQITLSAQAQENGHESGRVNASLRIAQGQTGG